MSYYEKMSNVKNGARWCEKMLFNTAEKPLVNSRGDTALAVGQGGKCTSSRISYSTFHLFWRGEFMAKRSPIGKDLASIASLGCDTFSAQAVEPICFRTGNNMLVALMQYPCAACKSTVYGHWNFCRISNTSNRFIKPFPAVSFCAILVNPGTGKLNKCSCFAPNAKSICRETGIFSNRP